MVGGWKLSTWEPAMTLREEQNLEKLNELRGMADGELRGKLDRFRRPPPHEWSGRLAVLAGLVLFVTAGVRMYQTPATGEPAPVEEERETATGG
jgi:hypothetical protein